MASDQDFNVFISWSGPLAKQIAGVLHEWLPTMFDNIDPWFSGTDIPAGAAWFGEILDRLNSSDYGIIVITTENWQRPWLNFEAGSLSKKLKDDKRHVTPLLVNFEDVSQLTGHPLEQYNAVKLDKDGMRRLCESIAVSAGRNPTNVRQRFEQMWDDLDGRIEAAKKSAGEQPPPPEVTEPQRLDALTASVRSLEATVAQLVRSSTPRSGGLSAHVVPLRSGGLSHRVVPRGMLTNIEAQAIADEVSAIASAYRPVKEMNAFLADQRTVEVRLTLDGNALTPEEFNQILSSVSHLPVDLMITPPTVT